MFDGEISPVEQSRASAYQPHLEDIIHRSQEVISQESICQSLMRGIQVNAMTTTCHLSFGSAKERGRSQEIFFVGRIQSFT